MTYTNGIGRKKNDTIVGGATWSVRYSNSILLLEGINMEINNLQVAIIKQALDSYLDTLLRQLTVTDWERIGIKRDHVLTVLRDTLILRTLVIQELEKC
jgi:hypothetical protein